MPLDTVKTRLQVLDGENVEDSVLANRAEDSNGTSGRSARKVVTPLAHMPYGDQLEHKKNSLMQILKGLTRNARKVCPDGIPLSEWILKSREIGGLPCSLEGILASPVVNGYRNRCEFSVGYSLQRKITVGFMLRILGRVLQQLKNLLTAQSFPEFLANMPLSFRSFCNIQVYQFGTDLRILDSGVN
ncbi:zinc finger CCCH domain-containing protein 24-like [Prunus dulcis]|nr:zinc finger CCCH domain-containing protein 24-like [Prunus dulcis]